MWRLFLHSLLMPVVEGLRLLKCCMCGNSCAFRVSYQCLVFVWLRNSVPPKSEWLGKQLETHETPWLNSAGLKGRSVGSQPWYHRVMRWSCIGSRLESGDSEAVFRCEKPPPEHIRSLVPTRMWTNEGDWMMVKVIHGHTWTRNDMIKPCISCGADP